MRKTRWLRFSLQRGLLCTLGDVPLTLFPGQVAATIVLLFFLGLGYFFIYFFKSWLCSKCPLVFWCFFVRFLSTYQQVCIKWPAYWFVIFNGNIVILWSSNSVKTVDGEGGGAWWEWFSFCLVFVLSENLLIKILHLKKKIYEWP